ncbi:hypothetical protein FISHEDRAFT_65207 [Fistulina hepatica ATCC 64428]|uniref:MICOS complex subunit MIC10 n=1 Tax=Fistulina hepatica ATCC 64428 TaxID=1128425 RepID=A0A0D7AEQ2_9AGAR|nr:hypothetical protein FISHEDRAFT_65207 [Fistulina hepatica ATCC 64428]
MTTTTKPTSSEEIIGQKARFRRTSGIGFSAGIVASVILFRRKTWPISLATGFGAGMAYADCDRSFNPTRIPGSRIVPTTRD